jgi:esterase/lipase
MPKANVNQKVFSIPKSIVYTGQTLAMVSPKLATDFAFKLFRTSYKFPSPKREVKMFEKAEKSRVFISNIHREIQLYHCGKGDKKVLLIHGWAGRGTQLFAIAELFAQHGFQAISFDAPAHGLSQGKDTDMTQFIQSIHDIDKKHGPFEYAIGHSLGGMALVNAVKNGFNLKKMATVGCGNSINDICHQFVNRLGMKPKIGDLLKKKLDKKLGDDAEKLSTYVAARGVNIPVLVIHDSQDEDVPVSAATHIYDNLIDGALFITNGLGHRKILYDKQVLDKLKSFFEL